MINTNFHPIVVDHVDYLEELVKDGIEAKENHYYFFVNDWDKNSLSLKKKLAGMKGETPLHVISIWDIPNAIQVIRSVIKNEKESMSTAAFNEAMTVPSLLVLHGAFPRIVSYPGAYWAELGIN